jgi:hypothetical protein
VRKEWAADNRSTEDLLNEHLLNLVLYDTVIEKNQTSMTDTLRQPFVLDWYVIGSAHKVFDGQYDLVPFFQQERLIQEFSDSNFGAGKIRHNQAMTLELCCYSAYVSDILLMPLQRSVGKIEPRDIHPLQHQALQNRL